MLRICWKQGKNLRISFDFCIGHSFMEKEIIIQSDTLSRLVNKLCVSRGQRREKLKILLHTDLV
jgi:hypothetical protein